MSDDTGAGPCAFCGDPDASHRVRDAIVGRVAAGEPVGEVAEDYGWTVEAVTALIDRAEG